MKFLDKTRFLSSMCRSHRVSVIQHQNERGLTGSSNKPVTSMQKTLKIYSVYNPLDQPGAQINHPGGSVYALYSKGLRRLHCRTIGVLLITTCTYQVYSLKYKYNKYEQLNIFLCNSFYK